MCCYPHNGPFREFVQSNIETNIEIAGEATNLPKLTDKQILTMPITSIALHVHAVIVIAVKVEYCFSFYTGSALHKCPHVGISK